MDAGNQARERDLRARPFWLFVGWSMVLFIVYLSLAPISINVGVEQGDKYLHAIAYGGVMFWFANLYTTPAKRTMLAIALVALGIGLEFVQGLTDYRTFEVADMLADAAGVAVGWVVAPPRLPNFLRGVERVFQS